MRTGSLALFVTCVKMDCQQHSRHALCMCSGALTFKDTLRYTERFDSDRQVVFIVDFLSI